MGVNIMISRTDLEKILVEALQHFGKQAYIIQICKWIWDNYAEALNKSGDLLYTWQYDIRWAATNLRKKGIILSAELSPKGLWILV